jgi:small-conductance mechanosensitive channel
MVGYFGGALLKDIVLAGIQSVEITFAATLGKLIHGVVFFVSVVVAVDQIGIDVTFLTTLLSLTLGALLFATGLSFGLGARLSVSNILASYNVRKIYRVGQLVRVGDVEGRIVRITANAVIIGSQGVQVHIPARLFDESVSVRIDENSDAGR